MNVKWNLFIILLAMVVQVGAFAKNSHPSSGRRLSYGHWLTCDSAGQAAYRGSNFFTRTTDLEKTRSDVPHFRGAYSFAVKDTWEEYVTHSGSDCGHCGETCTTTGTGQNQTRTCSCNFCSWQELETFYRPWSNQVTKWQVDWVPDSDYQAKRSQWIQNGSKDVVRDKSNLTQLLEFDPDRPQKYYLFPGEVEEINVSNDYGATIEPNVSISRSTARHEYKIATLVNGRSGNRQCDDVDLAIQSKVYTGQRRVTNPPNSIEFRGSWADGEKNTKGQFTQEPAKFRLVDVSAMFYEGQSLLDHYKNNKVQVRLRQQDRYFWFDRFISGPVRVNDTTSFMKFDDGNPDAPPFAEFTINSSDLFKTPVFSSDFHLKPGKIYEVCTQMYRANNLYYNSKGWFGREIWSDWNCGMFTYSDKARDLRSFSRKVRDNVTRFDPIPIPWY